MVLNGLVLTISPKRKHASLEAFHASLLHPVITDYFMEIRRFLLFQRQDVEFEVLLSTDPCGVQTEGIDGRQAERPVFYSNQMDVSTLPFVTGPVERNFPCFPWRDSLEAWPYEKSPWMIGSRGLPEEENYSRRVEERKL
jgi:hypothetical protein